MPTECSVAVLEFTGSVSLAVLAAFDGRSVTSDTGVRRRAKNPPNPPAAKQQKITLNKTAVRNAG
jgi:hypothetical protein